MHEDERSGGDHTPSLVHRTVMGEDIFREHRAQREHLVTVRTHHRRDDARAENSGQQRIGVRRQHLQQNAVGLRPQPRHHVRADHAQEHARQPDQHDRDRVDHDRAFERRHLLRG